MSNNQFTIHYRATSGWIIADEIKSEGDSILSVPDRASVLSDEKPSENKEAEVTDKIEIPEKKPEETPDEKEEEIPEADKEKEPDQKEKLEETEAPEETEDKEPEGEREKKDGNDEKEAETESLEEENE